MPYMREACTWFGEKVANNQMEVAMMVGQFVCLFQCEIRKALLAEHLLEDTGAVVGCSLYRC